MAPGQGLTVLFPGVFGHEVSVSLAVRWQAATHWWRSSAAGRCCPVALGDTWPRPLSGVFGSYLHQISTSSCHIVSDLPFPSDVARVPLLAFTRLSLLPS